MSVQLTRNVCPNLNASLLSLTRDLRQAKNFFHFRSAGDVGSLGERKEEGKRKEGRGRKEDPAMKGLALAID